MNTGTPTPDRATPDGWQLVWQDGFDGEVLDPAKWGCESGSGFFHGPERRWVPGWGNNELQCYTDLPSNLRVADGCLHLIARRERRDGCDFTSARLRTRSRDGRSLFAARYGRIEARARAPAGRGLWSAIWLLPQVERYGFWPASGEIDMVEIVGDRVDEYLGSLHFGAPYPQRSHVTHTHGFGVGVRIDEFHDYALEWDPGEIRWYFDGFCWARQTAWWSCSHSEGGRGQPPRDDGDLNPWPAPFDQPFEIILNLAVGGGLPGPPDVATVFPATFSIDHLRVFQRSGEQVGPTPQGA